MRRSRPTLQDSGNFGAAIEAAHARAIRDASCTGCGARIGSMAYAWITGPRHADTLVHAACEADMRRAIEAADREYLARYGED